MSRVSSGYNNYYSFRPGVSSGYTNYYSQSSLCRDPVVSSGHPGVSSGIINSNNNINNNKQHRNPSHQQRVINKKIRHDVRNVLNDFNLTICKNKIHIFTLKELYEKFSLNIPYMECVWRY